MKLHLLRRERGSPFQDIVRPVLPLTSTAPSAVQCALQDRLREASESCCARKPSLACSGAQTVPISFGCPYMCYATTRDMILFYVRSKEQRRETFGLECFALTSLVH